MLKVIRVFGDPDHDISICRRCGSLGKFQFLPTRKTDQALVYTPASWTVNPKNNARRLRHAITLATKHRNLASDRVLDIGAGTGLLYDALAEIVPTAQYFALETSDSCNDVLRSKIPHAQVIEGTINEVQLRAENFGAIFVCGVDYLFDDWVEGFRRIYKSLQKDGIAIVNRNTFVDLIETQMNADEAAEALFAGNNPLITNWFHTEQYMDLLSSMFAIVENSKVQFGSRDQESGRAHISIFTILRKARSPRKISSDLLRHDYFQLNMNIIDRLFSLARPTPLIQRI